MAPEQGLDKSKGTGPTAVSGCKLELKEALFTFDKNPSPAALMSESQAPQGVSRQAESSISQQQSGVINEGAPSEEASLPEMWLSPRQN